MKVRNIYSKIEYPYQFSRWDEEVQNKDCYEVLDWGDLVMGIQIMADSSRNDWKVFDRDHMIRIIASKPHRYVYRELDEADWMILKSAVASTPTLHLNSKEVSSEKGIVDLDANEDKTFKKGKDYLLAIGINKYNHFTPLGNAVKDVLDVVKTLTSLYGFKEGEPYIKYLLDEHATRKNIIGQLKKLCDVDMNDRVLIFYSGHGHLDLKTKHGFWIPVDAQIDDESSYIPNSTLRDYLKAIPCRHILLISDSCFSVDLLTRNANEKHGAITTWEQHKSRWMFCSGKGLVSDGNKGENSPFAKEIIKYLEEHKSNPTNIARLADEVTQKVRYNYEQQAEASPLQGTGHEGGQFIFYPRIEDEKNIYDKSPIHTFNRWDGAHIETPQTLPVAYDDTTQVGLAIATNHEDVFVALTVRFKSGSQNISGNLTVYFEDNALIKFDLIDAQLAYIDGNGVAQGIFLATEKEINQLKKSEIKTVLFHLTDGVLRTYQAMMNMDVLRRQLIDIFGARQKEEMIINEDVETTSRILSFLPDMSVTSTKVLINLTEANPRISSNEVRIAIEVLVEFGLANWEKPKGKHDKIWLTTKGRYVKSLPNGFREFYESI